MAQTLDYNKNVVEVTPVILTAFDDDMEIIQKLDDEPNDVGGLTAAELKREFDKGGLTVQDFINNQLIPAVVADDMTEQARSQAEAERVRNEIERVSFEDDRRTAEIMRETAENARDLAEQERVDETRGTIAEAKRQAAEAAEIPAKSWAVGGTGTRDGEDTNNAKYWSDIAKTAAGGGVISVNGKMGDNITLTAEDVGAIPDGAINAEKLGVFRKEECVTEDVAQPFGLDGTANVRDMFDVIGKFLYARDTTYRWKKTIYFYAEKVGGTSPNTQVKHSLETPFSGSIAVRYVDSYALDTKAGTLVPVGEIKNGTISYTCGAGQRTSETEFYAGRYTITFTPSDLKDKYIVSASGFGGDRDNFVAEKENVIYKYKTGFASHFYYNPGGGLTDGHAMWFYFDKIEPEEKTRYEYFASTNASEYPEDGTTDSDGCLWNTLTPVSSFVPTMTSGTYTGTGVYGSANQNKISLPFTPRFIIIKSVTTAGLLFGVWVDGSVAMTVTASGNAANTNATVTLEQRDDGGCDFSWYGTAANNQLNSSANNYAYFAIGK